MNAILPIFVVAMQVATTQLEIIHVLVMMVSQAMGRTRVAKT
jgi:hypothetical protein